MEVVMPVPLLVASHLTETELRNRAKNTRNPDERMRWIAITQKMAGRSTTLIADFCNRKPDWVRRVVRLYNAKGPDAIKDGRVKNSRPPLLDATGLLKLRYAMENESPPGGGLWDGPKVARWMSAHLQRKVGPQMGWKYLTKRLKWSQKVPLPSHPQSDEQANETFKKGGSTKSWRALHRAILMPL